MPDMETLHRGLKAARRALRLQRWRNASGTVRRRWSPSTAASNARDPVSFDS
jgi:hypothetical protein